MQLLIRGRLGLLPILLHAFLKYRVVAGLPTNNEQQQQHGFDANAATPAKMWSFDSTSQLDDPHSSMAPVTYDPSFIPNDNNPHHIPLPAGYDLGTSQIPPSTSHAGLGQPQGSLHTQFEGSDGISGNVYFHQPNPEVTSASYPAGLPNLQNDIEHLNHDLLHPHPYLWNPMMESSQTATSGEYPGRQSISQYFYDPSMSQRVPSDLPLLSGQYVPLHIPSAGDDGDDDGDDNTGLGHMAEQPLPSHLVSQLPAAGGDHVGAAPMSAPFDPAYPGFPAAALGSPLNPSDGYGYPHFDPFDPSTGPFQYESVTRLPSNLFSSGVYTGDSIPFSEPGDAPQNQLDHGSSIFFTNQPSTPRHPDQPGITSPSLSSSSSSAVMAAEFREPTATAQDPPTSKNYKRYSWAFAAPDVRRKCFIYKSTVRIISFRVVNRALEIPPLLIYNAAVIHFVERPSYLKELQSYESIYRQYVIDHISPEPCQPDQLHPAILAFVSSLQGKDDKADDILKILNNLDSSAYEQNIMNAAIRSGKRIFNMIGQKLPGHYKDALSYNGRHPTSALSKLPLPENVRQMLQDERQASLDQFVETATEFNELVSTKEFSAVNLPLKTIQDPSTAALDPLLFDASRLFSAHSLPVAHPSQRGVSGHQAEIPAPNDPGSLASSLSRAPWDVVRPL
ncbi:hypothetical protein CXG81DRAFT_21466 [Caulochytrium protostelioides]|uniref:Uncharacterized protein n=1 Tax=Caulochytrium protostelioides TaxID=1555241 RepID=A0A4P9X0N1_9FUNG|nr:hypothetical protein CXG81DRAFT_21466 [Caulochytrium protostelioides]|eukprot:RKO98283.1 hypothetical protein CXG81DRAFT_21466 [Caulochytrium protostelioides]